jgi:IS30 family transposase
VKDFCCSNKTISNELKRCSAVSYCAEDAHYHALIKHQNATKAHKKTDDDITKTKLLLELKVSPEQILGRIIT